MSASKLSRGLPALAGLVATAPVLAVLFAAEPDPAVGADAATATRAALIAPAARAECVGGVGGLGVVEPAGGAHRVGAPAEGVVREVQVRAGARVVAGQTLFVMDDRAARAEIALARRSLALAEARRAALAAELRQRREAVRMAEAALEGLAAAAEDAGDHAMIVEQLGGASVSQRERTHRRLMAARARAEVAEAAARRDQAVAARDALDTSRGGERARVADAEVEEAAARLALAEAHAERLVVRAPIDGVALDVTVRAGERVERGGPAPVLIGAAGAPHLRAEIDALDLARFERARSDQGAVIWARRRGADASAPIRVRFLRMEPLIATKSVFDDALSEPQDRRVAVALFRLPEGAARIGELLELRAGGGCGLAVVARNSEGAR